MLFQNKLKELYNDIQLSFGFKRLDECFTVDVDFKNENFVLKAIKCLSNFVNEKKKTVVDHGIDFPILPNSLLQFLVILTGLNAARRNIDIN